LKINNIKFICHIIIKGPVRMKDRFRTEGKIHLPEGQPEVWNYE